MGTYVPYIDYENLFSEENLNKYLPPNSMYFGGGFIVCQAYQDRGRAVGFYISDQHLASIARTPNYMVVD